MSAPLPVLFTPRCGGCAALGWACLPLMVGSGAVATPRSRLLVRSSGEVPGGMCGRGRKRGGLAPTQLIESKPPSALRTTVRSRVVSDWSRMLLVSGRVGAVLPRGPHKPESRVRFPGPLLVRRLTSYAVQTPDQLEAGAVPRARPAVRGRHAVNAAASCVPDECCDDDDGPDEADGDVSVPGHAPHSILFLPRGEGILRLLSDSGATVVECHPPIPQATLEASHTLLCPWLELAACRTPIFWSATVTSCF